MERKHYRLLVKRFLDGRLTDDELEVFIHLAREGKLDTCLAEAINAEAGIDAGSEEDHIHIPFPRRKPFAWLRYAAAIILPLLAVTALYLGQKPRLRPSGTPPPVVIQAVRHDVLPGGNRAMLTLGNGKVIPLNNSRNGQIARQGMVSIRKVQAGRLVYQPQQAPGPRSLSPVWNTISTPKGGQYQVALTDGTIVWLNSASSISFPVSFSGRRREVKISGEAYFEVAENASRPFYVHVKSQTVQVLGTRFNINAYDDESSVKTTLLEGSISIATGNAHRLLLPGQQAVVNGQDIRLVRKINTAAAIAWKNGYFIFDHTDLPGLMRQFSRWYNIQVVYKGQIPPHEFVGEIKRDTRLSEVLKILSASDIHFAIENNNLIITP